jgi:hypothetical protein
MKIRNTESLVNIYHDSSGGFLSERLAKNRHMRMVTAAGKSHGMKESR